MEKQFALTYYTNMCYKDVIDMTPFEIDNMLHKLNRVKELEAERIKT